MTNNGKPRFSLGRVVATPGALEAMAASGQNAAEFIDRHAHGDWGEVDAEDRQANEDALVHGDRLLSVYKTAKDHRLWILTEHDRSVTTICLASEY
ncbi:MAG: hypothetical protein HYX68_14160 [Planctomycetes bacterium]|nr:hypothetical protein [Planctomycetota bacterium]